MIELDENLSDAIIESMRGNNVLDDPASDYNTQTFFMIDSIVFSNKLHEINGVVTEVNVAERRMSALSYGEVPRYNLGKFVEYSFVLGFGFIRLPRFVALCDWNGQCFETILREFRGMYCEEIAPEFRRQQIYSTAQLRQRGIIVDIEYGEFFGFRQIRE